MKNEKIKCQGVVLKTTDYKENANLITILTNDGIKNLIIRGTKKLSSKMRSLTNIFNIIEIVQTDNGGLNTITEGSVIKNYAGFYDDVLKISYAEAIIEKILVLNSSITNYETLYQFVIKIFDLLLTSKEPELVVLVFETKLLYLVGIAPNFKECVNCHKKEANRLILSEGGVVCDECIQKNRYAMVLNENETMALKIIYLIKIERIEQDFYDTIRPFYQKLNFFIDLYYSNFLDFTSKTKKIINQISN